MVLEEVILRLHWVYRRVYKVYATNALSASSAPCFLPPGRRGMSWRCALALLTAGGVRGGGGRGDGET